MDASDDKLSGSTGESIDGPSRPEQHAGEGDAASSSQRDAGAPNSAEAAGDQPDAVQTEYALSTSPSTDIAVRRQAVQLDKERAHVASLQESLSALAATGAEMAALLNWKTNAYNELTDGLKRLLSIRPAGSLDSGYIEASSYEVLPSTNRADTALTAMAWRASSSPAELNLQTALPVDVTTILSEVERLTRGQESDRVGMAELEQTLDERDAEIDGLQEALNNLNLDVDNRDQLLAKVREGIQRLFDTLESTPPQPSEGSVVDDAWDSEDAFDVLADLDELGKAASESIRQLHAKQDALAAAKRNNDALSSRNAALSDSAAEHEAETRDIESMAGELESLLASALSEDEVNSLRATLAANDQDGGSASRIGDFAAIIAAAVTAVRRRDKALAVSEDARASLQTQLGETIERLEQSEADASDLQEQLQLSEAGAIDLQERLANRDSAYTALEDEKNAADAELAQRAQTLADMDERAGILLARLEDLLQSEGAMASVEEAADTGDSPAEDSADTSAEEDGLEEDGLEYDALDVLADRIDTLIGLLGSKNQVVAESELAQEDLGERLASLQVEYDGQSNLSSDLQAQLDASHDELAALHAQIGEIGSVLDGVLQQAGVDLPKADDGAAGDGAAGDSAAEGTDVRALGAKVNAVVVLLANKDEAVAEAGAARKALEQRMTSLQSEVEGKFDLAKELQSALDDRTEELDGIAAKIDEVRARLSAALLEAGVDLTAAVDESQEDAADAGDEDGAEGQTADETVDAADEKVDAVDDDSIAGNMATLASGVDALLVLLSEKMQALQDTESGIASLEERAAALVDSNKSLQEKLDESTQAAADAQTRQETFQAKIDELTGRSNDLDTHVSELNDSLATMEADKSALADKLSEIESMYAQTTEDYDAAQADVAAKTDELNGVTARLAEITADVSAALQDAGAGEVTAGDTGGDEGEADAEEATAGASLDELAAGVTALAALLRTKLQNLEESEGSLAALQDQLEEATQAANDAQTQGVELQALVDELKGSRDELDVEASGLKDQLAERSAQLDEVSGERQKLADETSSLSDQLAALKDQLDGAEAEKSQLADRMSALESDSQKASKDHETALAAKVAQIKVLTDAQDDLHEQVAGLSARLTRLNDKLGEVEAERYEVQERLAQLERDFDDATKDHEAALAEKDAVIDRLTQDAAAIKAGMDEKERALEEIQARLTALDEEQQERQSALDNTETLLQERSAELDNAKSRLAAVEVELASEAEERDALLDVSDIRMVNVPGTWQGAAEIECGEWDPGCKKSRLRKRRDGTYRSKFAVPPGFYEVKVAINGSWDENYGAGGVANGPAIGFRVGEEGEVTFSYDPRTHELSVT